MARVVNRMTISQLVAALRQCTTGKDLEGGRKLHQQAVAASCHTDKYVASALITLYRKCSKMELAREVLDEMPQPNTINWNCLLFGYVENGDFSLALHLFHSSMKCQPDSFTFVALLKSCAGLGGETGLAKGILLHQKLKDLALDLHSNLVLANTLLDMYCKCGGLVHARALFDTMATRDVVSWTCLIGGYVKKREYLVALELVASMDCKPDYCVCVAGLKACAGLGGSKGLEMGAAMHQVVKRGGFESHPAVSSTLVDMFSKCGSMQDAWEVFRGMKHKGVVAWNCLLLGFVDNGESLKALELFETMDCEPTDVTFLAALRACAALADGKLEVGEWLHKGRSIHDRVVELGFESDMVLASTLLDMYCKCNSMTLARRVFESMPKKDVVTWNCFISGCVENREYLQALELFQRMDCHATDVSFLAALRACAGAAAAQDEKGSWLRKGAEIHRQILGQGLQSNVWVANTLVDMYCKCGDMPQAHKVFDDMKQHRDVVSWNCLMMGYVENGLGSRALELFSSMECQPTEVTCAIALKACAALAADAKIDSLPKAMAIHEVARKHGFEADATVASCLLDAYSKCGCMASAREAFEQQSMHRGVVVWNCLILGYVENGENSEALELFFTGMDVEPSCVTFIGALKACGNLVALPAGKRIHAAVCRRGFEQDQLVATALVNFYRRCGCMEVAVELFNGMVCEEIESWTALLAGYSSLGDSARVFLLAEQIVDAGLPLDGVVFTCILTACSHTGMVERAREVFRRMQEKHGITPSVEHYTCMVDTLGRANRLEEALGVINTMPMKPDRVTWTTLLGACRKWHNLKVGEAAFRALVAGSGSKDAAGAAYVLMADIYSGLGMQGNEEQVERERKMEQAWKKPGESWWTDARGRTYRFLVGEDMDEKVEDKLLQVLSGYTSDSGGGEDGEKCKHSEKLAIAHALVHSGPDEAIRIVKNIRVCSDCHRATSHISKVEKREIIIRDASRFHIFKEGKCSCGDYW